MLRILSYFLPLLILCSCSTTYIGKDVARADEFVADSYLIKEGKFSILALEGKRIGKIDEEMMQEYPDAIYEDDILNIEVYHPSRNDIPEAVSRLNASQGYRVINGKVLLPDSEEIPVSGLSLDQARKQIQNHYTTQQEIHDIDVFLDYKERPLHKIELIGLVQRNTIPVDGKMRAYDALSKASVSPAANFFMSYIIREGIYLPVDLSKLIHEGDMSQNIVMRGGDKLYIAPPQEAVAMIMGEVGLATAVSLPKGYMSLKEALVLARGIPYSGNRQGILVIRGNVINPKIYLLTWNQIMHLPNDSALIMPGDTVYVTTTLLANWNRFISQLLPSFEGLRSASAAASVVAP